jgi:MoxR-like ATPase
MIRRLGIGGVCALAVMGWATSSALAADAGLDRWKAQAARVTITRDDWGIAHIRGKSDADAVFGMIYAQAEDDFPRIERNYLVSLGRLAEAEGAKNREALTQDIFSEKFLIRRPLLQALQPDVAGPPVLLIDELDRTDEPFEAYLLEVLSDFQLTIPELGTIKAEQPPIVILTSNRTREIHDAIKRRCFYHWVDYPDAERELAILRRKAPGVAERLSQEVVAFVQRLRKMDLFKLPGVAETLDWSKALTALDAIALSPQTVNDTLGTLLKYQDDIARVRGTEAERILSEVQAELNAR